MSSNFQAAFSRLEKSINVVKTDPEVIEKLKVPQQILEVNCPVRMDNNKIKNFTGFRVRYNDILGPTKGGIRFHVQVTREEIITLSFLMTLKCALLGLPYGGAKGGVVVDPKSLSKLELERLSRSYISRIASFIGPDLDIPAPDLYTNSRIMAWMLDEYNTIAQRHCPAVITGKPVALGGSVGRDDATGRGAYYCIKELEETHQWQPKNITVAIQGFGNAGQHVASLLYQDGYKIVAISDSKGAIYNKAGFVVPDIITAKQEKAEIQACYHGGVASGTEKISNAELLQLSVDILIPAALEDQIDSKNAHKVKAKYIVEVANGPIKPEADQILHKQNIQVIPDILANAGGVVVSYFEWIQNKTSDYWPEHLIHGRLHAMMQKAFTKIMQIAKMHNITLRDAAYIAAVERIAMAVSSMGTYEYFK